MIDLELRFQTKERQERGEKDGVRDARAAAKPKPNRLQSCHTLFAAEVISCADTVENNPCYFWEAAEEVASHFSSRISLKGYDNLFS